MKTILFFLSHPCLKKKKKIPSPLENLQTPEQFQIMTFPPWILRLLNSFITFKKLSSDTELFQPNSRTPSHFIPPDHPGKHAPAGQHYPQGFHGDLSFSSGSPSRWEVPEAQPWPTHSRSSLSWSGISGQAQSSGVADSFTLERQIQEGNKWAVWGIRPQVEREVLLL